MPPAPPLIRSATPADIDGSYAVYRDAVRLGAAPAYSEAQRLAWVPSDTTEPWWAERILSNATWVSERSGAMTGVISLRSDGHLDLFFVRPDARGDGTAVALYDQLLGYARTVEHARLMTFASHLLRPFLEKRGWEVLRSETVIRQDVALERFEMELADLG